MTFSNEAHDSPAQSSGDASLESTSSQRVREPYNNLHPLVMLIFCLLSP